MLEFRGKAGGFEEFAYLQDEDEKNGSRNHKIGSERFLLFLFVLCVCFLRINLYLL